MSLRIVVITSCTGEKTVAAPDHLQLADFRKGPAHVAGRMKALAASLVPAEALYSGQQHRRLMRGVVALRKAGTASVDLHILSAGYGLVPADRPLAPYEATFQGMGRAELRSWADALAVPAQFRAALAAPFDLALVLLGDDYLDACALDAQLATAGPVLMFCGAGMGRRLPRIPALRPVALGNAEARRFSCGLVALKGELAARILERVATDPGFAARLVFAPDPLAALEADAQAPATRRAGPTPKPDVDRVVAIPQSWRDKPHRASLSYFIPEWDDLVDRDYDFRNDIHSAGGGDWSNEVYAHQLYPEPNYDGILISKVVAEKSRRKKERINRLGVHRFLRVPREFPIMGDCGAFGYINEKQPPYTTDEILDYYSRLDFDFGVSIDHLIVSATEAEKKHRYDLTIENAAEFLKQHRKAKLPWTPIGAVQGWDPASYAAAARKYVAMGYRYIGLGGLVRTSTREVLELLREVHTVVPAHVKIHLFGLARLSSMRAFADLGVSSVDSASLLRRAWMGTGQNYLAMDGRFYTAIRIPEAGKSFRAKRMVSEGRASEGRVERLEARCLQAMVDFDEGRMPVAKVLDILEDYDRLITPDRPPTRELLRDTLEAAPWKSCSCDICRRDGIQVVIFRGNNRNRRRGFHNTYVFYRLLQRVLAGEKIDFSRIGDLPSPQLGLFDRDEVDDGRVDAL